MKVIPPVDITSANGRLTSSTIPDVPSASGAWSSGSSYTAGVIVSRTTTNSFYRALVDHSASSISPEDSIISSTPKWTEIGSSNWASGTYSPGQKVRYTDDRVYTCLVSTAAAPSLTPPSLSSGGVTYWVDSGPTNRLAMFDYLRNSASKAQSTITVRLTPGQRISAIAFVGLKNVQSIRVRADTNSADLNAGTNLMYENTKLLPGRETTGFYQYFFTAITYATATVFDDLPLDTNIIVEVLLTGTNIECGGCIIGYAENIGTLQRGASNDVTNFSSVTRDTFGNASMVPRRNVPRTNQTLFLNANQINTVRRLRDALNAKPAVWVGLDDLPDQYYFETLLIVGFYKTFTISLDNHIGAMINLELEEI